MADEDRLLGLSPDKTLTFTWNKADDQPVAYLTPSNLSKDSYIAYKVKTTAPKRYVVRPPQGIIEPGQEASIKLSMVMKDAEALWHEALDSKSKGNGNELKCDDKFLVQTTIITSSFYQSELSGKDDKAMAIPLQKLWKTLGDEDKKLGKDDKKAIKSNKLQTGFVFPSNMSSQPKFDGGSSSSSSSSVPPSLMAPSSPLRSSPHGSAEAVFAELSALRKKYDDLVAYTVVLTGERDFLQTEVDAAQNDKNIAKKKKESEVNDGNSASDGTITKAPEGSSFSFIHLIAVALIAFIVGRLIA